MNNTRNNTCWYQEVPAFAHPENYKVNDHILEDALLQEL